MKILIIIVSLIVYTGGESSGKCSNVASEPTCASNGQVYANPCLVGQNNLKVACWNKCSCDSSCYELYEPVCGSDGITYSNRCFLLIAACSSKGKIHEVAKSQCAVQKE